LSNVAGVKTHGELYYDDRWMAFGASCGWERVSIMDDWR